MQSSRKSGITSAIPTAARTVDRPVYTAWKRVQLPSLARANLAVTEQSPDGTTDDDYSTRHASQTVLQQHCDFFDLNSDGVITPWETFVAMRLLEWNLFMALLATFIIHSGFSYVTRPPHHYLPDPLFRIHIKQIHNAKHGSDSNTYDHEGRFRPQQLADFFSKYGRRLDSAGGSVEYGLTFGEAMRGAWSQRCVFDFFGVAAAHFEWSAAYLTIWPQDGVMRMEDVRGLYDGSYFFKVAGQKRAQYIAHGNPLSVLI